MRESSCQDHTTHNPSGEVHWASRMRENRTYGSYGEGLETDRESYSAPRQSLTRQTMFQKLESVLHSEVRTLGYPRAALFSFCVAVLAYNVLGMLQTAVEAQHQIEPNSSAGLSLYFVATEVKAIHAGMMIAIPAKQWNALRRLSHDDFRQVLLEIAASVAPATFRKNVRGPKKVVKRESIPPGLAGAHVSTSRLLKKTRLPS